MNLQELHNTKKTNVVKRALREHYEMDIDFERMNLKQSQNLLANVKGLLKEARTNKAVHESHSNGAYLKLVMMEQALADHINDLRVQRARIVIENEEVQKSQVILAAQDMIDSIQKMREQVSKMEVEELNAVVVGMKNEFGTSQGDQFNSATSESLKGLLGALDSAKQGLTSALGMVTGEVGPESGGMPGMDQFGGEDELGGAGLGGEEDLNANIDVEEPAPEEPEDVASAGRPVR